MHFPVIFLFYFILVTTDTLHALNNDCRARLVSHSTLLATQLKIFATLPTIQVTLIWSSNLIFVFERVDGDIYPSRGLITVVTFTDVAAQSNPVKPSVVLNLTIE